MSQDSSKPKKQSKHRPRGMLARPLDSLLFLLPLILFYEVACLLPHPPDGAAADDRVIAFHLLQGFFQLLGNQAAWMPGLAVVVVLTATHLVSRQPWRFRKKAVALMYVESVAWALPLIAVNHITQMAATRLEAQTWVANLALCVGSGIYEELVFRLVLISVLVIIGADLLRLPQDATLVASVLIAAVMFALHHHPPFGGDPFEGVRFTFRCLAGVFLGAIFVFRGYGPAAGAHIAHNLLIITLVG